jgi:CspA family cold shock protein
MQRGRVKWFNDAKGYGFIVLESEPDGPDVFVHYSAVQAAGFRTLSQGDLVELEVQETPKGLQALKVVRATRDVAGEPRTVPPGDSKPAELRQQPIQAAKGDRRRSRRRRSGAVSVARRAEGYTATPPRASEIGPADDTEWWR